MPFDAQGQWRPETSPKQDELRRLCQQYRFVAANGPRRSGKTCGCEHAFVEHGWNTVRGNDVIITISQTVGIDSGIWREFTENTIPEWIQGGFGMQWVRRPYTMGVSKKPTCEITNRRFVELATEGHDVEKMSEGELREAGATTVFQLESLKVEDEAEDRFKPKKYTGIYVPELTTFAKRGTFDTWTECLRQKNPDPRLHFLFLADFNPPDDESWWIHDLWWDLFEADSEDLDPTDFGFPDDSPESLLACLTMKRQLVRIDIRPEDNPYEKPEVFQMLKAKYAHNPDLYARYIDGIPTKTTEGSLFTKVFRPNFHCVPPEAEIRGDANPPMMTPESDCIELLCGWDPGTTNFAVEFAEKFEPPFERYKGKPCFKFLDEVVVVGEDFDLEELVGDVLKKMAEWEKLCGRAITWQHWSDRSVFDTKDLKSQKYYHQLIYEASDGQIELDAAEKGPNTLKPGLDLMRKLLYDERLWINSARCPKLIGAFKAVKKGKSERAVIQKGSPHKHPLDASRYLLQSECYDELDRKVFLHLRRANLKPGLVSVPT